VTGPSDFWKTLGFHAESGDEQGAVLRMDVPPSLMSPFGTVPGGIVATLFDTGLAVAIARRLAPEDRIATTSLTVSWVAFTRRTTLRCHARVVGLGRIEAVAEGEVVDDEGVLVAKALGTFNVRRSGAG
jgi:uncharacterized protein (TIGR00369 family)